MAIYYAEGLIPTWKVLSKSLKTKITAGIVHLHIIQVGPFIISSC